jgi:hypothetical protein
MGVYTDSLKLSIFPTLVPMSSVHLGFDMGIRNLAYCLMRHTTTEDVKSWSIVSWDNIDLLEGGVTAQDAKRCCACTSPATWISVVENKKWCKGCATGIRRKKTATEKPGMPILPCALTVKPMKEFALANGMADAKKAKKEVLVAWFTARYLIPWKASKATDSSLTTILRAMDTWLNSMLPTFASATLIRLENQPVMKGPTMKSVQMILFTLLSHRLGREYGWTGRIEFVHAGTKSKGAVIATAPTPLPLPLTTTVAAEGAAYRARKKTAETDVVDILTKAGVTTWLEFFDGRSKKSDLADAFLMALRDSGI